MPYGFSWPRWARPFPYTRHVVVGAMSLMWSAGGVLALLSVLLPHPDEMRDEVVIAVAVGALVVGGLSWLARERMSMRVLAVATVAGTLAVSVIVGVAGGGATSVSFSFVYAWIVVYALMFFPPQLAAAEIVIAAVSYAVVYRLLGSFTAAEPLLLGGVIVVTGIVVVVLSNAREHAEIDGLTNIANRRALDRHLGLAIEQVQACGGRLAIAMIDVDHFKRINDAQGHDAGDRVLEQLAQAWLGLIRNCDVLARFGGDEFTVVLPGALPDEAAAVMERLRSAAPAGVTCSAGVAAWRRGDSISMLLNRADAALYDAKRLGRDRTITGEDDGAAAAGLKEALDAGQFVLHYQPIVSLRTQEITALEALVRWEHPERGLVPPEQFIPAAEASGIIVELGAWVIEQACLDAQQWPAQGAGGPPRVTVNLSARQLDEQGLVDVVTRALRQSGLPANRLTLELTETMLAQDRPRSVQRLLALEEIGVRLAMDDFGTGYSSLDQLRRLPVSTLKIDRSFIEDLPYDDDATALVEAMIGMARGLRLTVVAEGVQTAQQLQYLGAVGCEDAQGFLLGRPVSADAVMTLLLGQDDVRTPVAS